MRALSLDETSRFEKHLGRFYRARSGHNAERAAADLHIAHLDYGAFGAERLTDEFVGLENWHHTLDVGKRFEMVLQFALIPLRGADDADDRSLNAFGEVHAVSARFEVRKQLIALLRGGGRFENNYQRIYLL